MKYINGDPTYDKFPIISLPGNENRAFASYEEIGEELLKQAKNIYVVDCYPGVNDGEVLEQLKKALKPDLVLLSEDIFYDGKTLNKMMEPHLTEDRVRGVMYYGKITDFVDLDALTRMREKLQAAKGKRILIYGFGASLVSRGDVLVYADLSRWEIQLRYRKGMPNFKQENDDEDFLKKYKRGYFIEWRIADKHKRSLFREADYWLDTNKENAPVMIAGHTFQQAMDQAVSGPFRTVPYFDPGVWGGQWLKAVCGLDGKEDNYAWSFDGVPEENALFFGIDGAVFECPAMNLTLSRPMALLGEKVYSRFGAEFPIRFDFLDTMDGQNLSLQVHPTTDFIKETYGMPYTQEESYYLLDAKPGAKVYLGLKDNVDLNQMFGKLEEAQKGGASFPAEKYVNVLDAKPHDHFLIPPGTIHCSGKDCVVLEISSSAYIFTFKLWDWDRLGMDGLPRPIHLEEGRAVVNPQFTTKKVMREMVNQFEILHQEEGYLKERTGLHKMEFIDSHRHTFSKPIRLEVQGNLRVLNLVDGEEITITSPDDAFAPYKIHYAETFIIPAQVSSVMLTPTGKSENRQVKVLEAFVR